MAALVLALLVHHADGTPYGWHMTCSAWMQRAVEIQADEHLDMRSRQQLIGYLKSKVAEPCDGLLI